MGGTTQRGFFQRTAEQIEAAKAQIKEQARQTWERGEDLAGDVAKGLRTYAEAQTTAAQLQAAQQAGRRGPDTLRLQNTFGKQGNIGENFGPNYLERVYGDRLVRFQNRKLADDHQDHVHAGGRN